MIKEYKEKCRRFCTPFLAAANTAAAENFSNFFLNIMKVNYSFYKRCKFHKGFWGKYIFLMGPEVKKTGRKKLLQNKNASTLSQVIFCT
jgi:hypothetical protein